MGILVRLSHSLLALLICVVAGWVAGYFWPALGEAAYVIGQVYLAVVSMAAIPLLVVATFFGLRQMMSLPYPGKRIAMIAAVAIALVLGCAVVGAAGALLFSPGAGLDSDARTHLGNLVQRQGGDTEMQLRAPDQTILPAPVLWMSIIPDNIFRVLAEGKSLGILLAAIFFGIGFAALPKEQTQALNRIFEGTYRGLELIINYANALLPIVAFGMSAHVFSKADYLSIASMGGFLLYFCCLIGFLSAVCIGVISLRSGFSVGQVLRRLKESMLVSIVSSSSTASIPHAIEALSSRLGFSRGIVELVIPTSSVFLRAGSATYYVLLTFFIANLYDRPMDAGDWVWVCVGATAAAFASAGTNSLVNVGFAAMTLSILQLPIEAALALFLAIDFLCEGLRNLLTLLASCVLVSLVAAGLPSEKPVPVPQDAAAVSPLQLVLTKGSAAILLLGGCLLALFIVLAGIGVGARETLLSTGSSPAARVISGVSQ